LKRVLAQFGLAEATRSSALSRRRVITPDYVQEVGALEPGRPIRNPFLIDQQRKHNAGFFAKQTRVIPVPESYGCYVCTRSFEIPFVFAQLRDMLAAEDSAVMTKKRHHRRRLVPE
jgi:hypothetical protein